MESLRTDKLEAVVHNIVMDDALHQALIDHPITIHRDEEKGNILSADSLLAVGGAAGGGDSGNGHKHHHKKHRK